MTDAAIGVNDGVDSSLSWSKFQCNPETGIMRIRGHLKLLRPPFKGEHLNGCRQVLMGSQVKALGLSHPYSLTIIECLAMNKSL
jgi:hypothetical protein